MTNTLGSNVLRYVTRRVLAIGLAFSGLTFIAAVVHAAEPARHQPLSPQESQAQLVVGDGLSSRLIAYEPDVVDPVEVTFDDAGRMWVVEMRDYPIRKGERPQGRVRVLEDQDLDGHFETATLFADELEMPTGLALWKDGVVVTVAGRVIYLRDTDADLIADTSEIWLEGFKEDNEQLRANHPRLGPDGWWYIASGLRGGEVRLGERFASDDSSSQTIGSRDVRFDLRSKRVELITGPAQFGLCFDPLGSRLFCSNRNPAVQVIFEQSDLIGNPLAGIVPSVHDVLPAGEASRVFPLVEAWTTSNLHAGQFTAACGVFARASQTTDSDPNSESLVTEIFVCEPTGSLVQRKTAAYQAERLAELESTNNEQGEWLASRDPWFRPVNITLAPDGELVVVDMHRAVIEHPQWVPEELKQRPDERWGDQHGRIYWVGHRDQWESTLSDLRRRPLGARTDQELVEVLSDSNPWKRQTAVRLLIERESTDSLQPLEAQVLNREIPLVARADALWLLAALQRNAPECTARLLMRGGESGDDELSRVACRVLRAWPSSLPGFQMQLRELAEVGSSSQRFEALLCLGLSLQSEAASQEHAPVVLSPDALANATAYQLVALGSAYRNSPGELLHQWLGALDRRPVIDLELVASTVAKLAMAASRTSQEARPVFDEAVELLRTSPNSSAQQVAALAVANSFEAAIERLSSDADFWKKILQIAKNSKASLAERREAVRLLGRSARREEAEILEGLVRAGSEPNLHVILLEAWSSTDSERCDQYLVEQLATAAPITQRAIVDLLLRKPARLELLAEALETKQIQARQIGAIELKKLVSRARGETQVRLDVHLQSIVNSDRAQIVAQYQSSLDLAANPTRGMEVFRKQCASCHRIGEIGIQVGPDISDSRTKKPTELLSAILDPNLAIDNNYFRFVVLTDDDRILDGMIAEETEDVIVLRGQDDKREVIRRDEIIELKATGVSLMPEGVEAQIDHQAMADLISFIKGWRYMDGAIPDAQ